MQTERIANSNMTLRARTWIVSPFPGCTERDCARSEVSCAVLKEGTLVVIDPWADHENKGLIERGRPRMHNLVRLIQLFRAHGRPIYYDATGKPIHPLIIETAGAFDHFLEWDPGGGGTQVLLRLLGDAGIRTVFWGGFHANLCIMHKPCGIRNIMPADWGRLHFLVRDATCALESSETLDGERLLDAACYEVEYYQNGYTCTVSAVSAAFGSATLS